LLPFCCPGAGTLESPAVAVVDHASTASLGPSLQLARGTFELGDGDHAVAVSNDLAACDRRGVGNRGVEVLVADPLRDKLRGLVGLLGGLEETTEPGRLGKRRERRRVRVSLA
jgi:hypothetical protein